MEHTLGELLREKYRSAEFDQLGWVWSPHIWEELEMMLKLSQSIRVFIADVEADHCNLGLAVAKYLEIRGYI